MDGGPGVGPVEEPGLEPVGGADRVEGEDHLEVVGGLGPQADVQLVEVPLQELAGLFDPDAGDVVDGLELFHVVQPGEEDFGAVGEAELELAPVDHGPGAGVVLGQLAPELGEAGLPQGAGHLPADQEAVAGFGDAALQELAPGEDGLAGAAAPLEDQVAAGVLEEGQEGLIGGLPQVLIPQGQAGGGVQVQPGGGVRGHPGSGPPPAGRPASPPGSWRPRRRPPVRGRTPGAFPATAPGGGFSARTSGRWCPGGRSWWSG